MLALGLGLLALAPPAVASATQQGVYEGCAPAASAATLDRCTARLARFRAAGFDVVLNYSSWYSSEANLESYAAAAERLGLKLIWPLNGTWWRDAANNLTTQYSRLAATCGCQDDVGFTAYVAGLVRGRPATWGWYVGDEIPVADREDALALSGRIRQLDPGHPQLLISQETGSTRGANLAPFVGLTEYAGADVYPIGTADPLDTVATVASGVRELVQPAGGRVAMVLQAFSWAAYPGSGLPDAPWPTASEMRAMRDDALSAASPALVLWYSAYDVLDHSPDPDGTFANLAWAATAPPATQFDHTSVTGRTVTVSFSSDAAGSEECRLDDREWERCSSPFQAGGLEVGRHALALRAHDLLGQTGPSATNSFTVAPVVISHLRAPRRLLTRRARLRQRRTRPWVGFSLDRADQIALTFSARTRRVRLAVDGNAGWNRVPFPPGVERRLVPGRWRFEISAEGARLQSRLLRVRGAGPRLRGRESVRLRRRPLPVGRRRLPRGPARPGSWRTRRP